MVERGLRLTIQHKSNTRTGTVTPGDLIGKGTRFEFHTIFARASRPSHGVALPLCCSLRKEWFEERAGSNGLLKNLEAAQKRAEEGETERAELEGH